MVDRVLFVTNIPTPYRIPFFNEIQRQMAARGMSLKLVFAALGYARRQWQLDLDECGFEYEVLPGSSFRRRGAESASFTYGGFNALLRRERPAVVIAVGYHLGTVRLWLRSWFTPTPYIIYSGEIASPALPVSRLRLLQRRLLVSRAVGYIAYGTRARDYLVSLGAPADRVQIAINTVDTEYFAREAAAHRPAQTGPEFLYVGHLTAGKRLDLLLAAFSRLARDERTARLTLVGDGPERASLEQFCRDAGIADRVAFEGFRQRDEIPRYLARARAFFFPSEYDVWGLVLVEAMAAGVPCVASIESGATVDLVNDGVTGYRADFRDVDAVVALMRILLDDPARAAAMGAAAGDFVREQVNLRVSAAGVVAAVVAAIGEPIGDGRRRRVLTPVVNAPALVADPAANPAANPAPGPAPSPAPGPAEGSAGNSASRPDGNPAGRPDDPGHGDVPARQSSGTRE